MYARQRFYQTAGGICRNNKKQILHSTVFSVGFCYGQTGARTGTGGFHFSNSSRAVATLTTLKGILMITSEESIRQADSIALPSSLEDIERLVAAARQGEASAKDVVLEGVQRVLQAMNTTRSFNENRLESRHPYPYPVHLTPMNEKGEPQLEETVIVLGRHLSDHGIDFYHREPLGERRYIASLPIGSSDWVGFMLELHWTRFSRHGWYDNGGKFVQKIASPLPPRTS